MAAFDPARLNLIRYRNEDTASTTVMGNDVSGTAATAQVDSFKSGVPLSGSTTTKSLGVGVTILATGNVENNIAIGSGALDAMTASNFTKNNIAIGVNALTTSTVGEDNVAIGSSALASLTNGYRNVAVGSNSQTSVTTATNNTSVGRNSMRLCVDGVDNTAIGYQALEAITSNSDCTAVGSSALLLATGAENTAIGYQAGNAITTGQQNTMLGSQTDCGAADSLCLSLGYQAVSGSWVLNTAAPISIRANATALSGSTPAIPANATNLLRVRINGTNYTIPLMADQ